MTTLTEQTVEKNMNAPANALNLLEPRPLYGIGTVARLTGLKPDTLRVWERRYGLGPCLTPSPIKHFCTNTGSLQLVYM